MLQCHKCLKTIPTDTGVQRSMQTSTYGDGTAFFRTVNLCRRCDNLMNRQDRMEAVKKVMLVLLAVAASIAGGVYLLFYR